MDMLLVQVGLIVQATLHMQPVHNPTGVACAGGCFGCRGMRWMHPSTNTTGYLTAVSTARSSGPG